MAVLDKVLLILIKTLMALERLLVFTIMLKLVLPGMVVALGIGNTFGQILVVVTLSKTMPI
jgi:ABC-type Fe3+ transport system permease subunit